MRTINLLVALSVFLFLNGCGKKDEKPVTEQKKTETTQQTTQQTTTQQSSDKQVYKISAVDEAKGDKVAPNVTWDENGKKVTFADAKGKVLFLNFWATWCSPCKKEMPDLSAINTELKDKNFKMYGINVFQKGNTTIDDVLKTIPVSYPILDGNDNVVKAFEKASGAPMDGVPTTFIVDKTGKIVETLVGVRDKDTYLTLIKKYL
ncbi:MAG: TlpA family protein disulfide reductase [Bacteroidetes bacterium]|nr:TlpA family protein disulfide reductase [Bacteroidota bacterium]